MPYVVPTVIVAVAICFGGTRLAVAGQAGFILAVQPATEKQPRHDHAIRFVAAWIARPLCQTVQ